MGLFTRFMGRRSAAPFQVTSDISPQENYAGYTSLPNLPMSPGDYVPDPYRMHSPFALEREQRYLTTAAGIHRFDAGDETIVHVREETLQTYFDQKATIDPQVILIPAHGVIVPLKRRQHGWQQAYAEPTEPVRLDLGAASPPVQLSTPLHVTAVDVGGKRGPILGGHAPKTKRGI